MKFDLHVHSEYSQDATGEVKELIKLAKKLGLSGLALTDHNEIKGSLKALEYVASLENFTVIPGVEVSSAQGHILALGIKQNIPRGLSPESTIEHISKLGGLAIAAHPCRLFSSLNIDEKFDGIEVFNSRCWALENLRAEKLATSLKLGATAGSDCHSINELGYGITEFATQSSEYEDLLEEIVKGRTLCSGKYIPRFSLLSQKSKSFLHFIKRGFKRI